MLLVVHATALAALLTPSFESYLSRATGAWKGATISWSPAEEEGKLPLRVAPGAITPPEPCSTVCEEVMRSCGGAVQGVRELRQPGDGEVLLNRQTDGTSFFSDGSWAQAPALLSDAPESSLLASPAGFGISATLAHESSRSRVLLVIIDKKIACCDVAIEAREGGEGDADEEGEGAARLLLDGRLQVVVEASAWEGGATVQRLVGTPPPGSAWLNARVGWAEEEKALAGGSPLVPAGATYLPGGVWCKVTNKLSDGGSGAGDGLAVEIGSICVDSAEVKTLRHEYVEGNLERVVHQRIVAADDGA